MENQISTAWYNTKEGIEIKISTLEGFHELLDERVNAYKIRHERLSQFYLLGGKYLIDTSAQCLILTGLEKIVFLSVATEEEKNLLVENYDTSRGALTAKESRADFKKARASGKPNCSGWSGEGWWPPELGVMCVECGKPWHMNNINDFYRTKSEFKCFSTERFVGKPLEYMWESYQNKNDAVYTISENHRVSNDSYVDMSPNPNYSSLPMNPNGFYPNEDGKTDPKYVLKKRDVIRLWVHKQIHESCLHNYVDHIQNHIQ